VDAGLALFIIYILPGSGVNINAKEFNCKVYYGLITYTIYITANGLCLNYQQFQSKIYVGIAPYTYYITAQATNGRGLDYLLFKAKIHYPLRGSGLSVYVLYVTTASQACRTRYVCRLSTI